MKGGIGLAAVLVEADEAFRECLCTTVEQADAQGATDFIFVAVGGEE